MALPPLIQAETSHGMECDNHRGAEWFEAKVLWMAVSDVVLSRTLMSKVEEVGRIDELWIWR